MATWAPSGPSRLTAHGAHGSGSEAEGRRAAAPRRRSLSPDNRARRTPAKEVPQPARVKPAPIPCRVPACPRKRAKGRRGMCEPHHRLALSQARAGGYEVAEVAEWLVERPWPLGGAA